MSRRTEEQAYLLHATPYRESSLVVDLFTRGMGRVAAIAKGAKRRGSALRAVLMQFQPLEIALMGRQELRTLVSAEWVGGMPLPQGDALLCAFYMNELLVRLLAREDPHPALYDGYAHTIAALCAGGDPHDAVLRRFEWLLLRETGYAPDLERDAEHRLISASGAYRWQPGAGFSASEPGDEGSVAGSTLRELAAGRLESPSARQQAKYLTRAILSHHLEGHPVNTRQILIDLQKL